VQQKGSAVNREHIGGYKWALQRTQDWPLLVVQSLLRPDGFLLIAISDGNIDSCARGNMVISSAIARILAHASASADEYGALM
jgi:hypothetical protein